MCGKYFRGSIDPVIGVTGFRLVGDAVVHQYRDAQTFGLAKLGKGVEDIEG